MLRSQGFYLQALALLRARLEETIVFSYLVHEPSDEAAKRYFTYAPIGEYLTARNVVADPTLSPHISQKTDLKGLEDQAAEIESDER